jgi:hypothetical protein
MSKELIEQLAKEHGALVHKFGGAPYSDAVFSFEFRGIDQLEAFAKAYAQTQGKSINDAFCCQLAWKAAKDKAWNSRNLKLCKCDHNESCEHCFPHDFRIGGKWAIKPAAPIESGVKG